MALLVAHELLTEQRQGGGDRQKNIFFSGVRPVLVVSRLRSRSRPRYVHTTPEQFESEALFLQLGLRSTLIRHENGALFLRLGLRSTLIRHENGALFLRLGLRSTLIT